MFRRTPSEWAPRMLPKSPKKKGDTSTLPGNHERQIRLGAETLLNSAQRSIHNRGPRRPATMKEGLFHGGVLAGGAIRFLKLRWNGKCPGGGRKGGGNMAEGRGFLALVRPVPAPGLLTVDAPPSNNPLPQFVPREPARYSF